MEPWLDDLADDLQSVSFTSTNTTTTINRSTSSGSSDAAALTPAPSAHGSFSSSSKSKSTHSISLSDLHFSLRLGSGDIGSVYLAEIKNSESNNINNNSLFAAKVMDKKELASRSKEGRARTEREILQLLDHPFLPTLYASLDSQKWLCLLTEFCPGGDLHVLRQRQNNKRFDETAVRFYSSEVIVALEYLHMLGIVYRDLKPENVLVRSDGHIMLTDFDLSLKCDDSTTQAQIISDHYPSTPAQKKNDHAKDHPPFTSSSCIIPNCIVPAVSCFNPKRKRKKKTGHHAGIDLPCMLGSLLSRPL
ncbi:hypothetical protein LWI28_015122 [Acer negundo]|uniref:non-specific serine/threonine protein kinase n=1 Tax=Acer negundo TaxID=4023 RepID=A0AAD5JDG4_ACENE|nr:hypothetical protein LWI28_015122 [Acer negundo]